MPERPFYKFPSTPYLLPPSMTLPRQDKVLSAKDAGVFFSEIVTVEEKIDGANLGISFNSDGEIQLQNRGHYVDKPYYGQWQPLENWLRQRMSSLFDVLLDEYILFGEWCYLTHSVYYNLLPDWFVAFDIYDKYNGQFLTVDRRNAIITKIGLAVVPHIFTGHISKESLDSFLGKSVFGNDICEGIYLRIDSSDYLRYRAKYVRGGFSQAIETHWRKKAPQKNSLCTE